jgi:hypothetical protein
VFCAIVARFAEGEGELNDQTLRASNHLQRISLVMFFLVGDIFCDGGKLGIYCSNSPTLSSRAEQEIRKANRLRIRGTLRLVSAHTEM